MLKSGQFFCSIRALVHFNSKVSSYWRNHAKEYECTDPIVPFCIREGIFNVCLWICMYMNMYVYVCVIIYVIIYVIVYVIVNVIVNVIVHAVSEIKLGLGLRSRMYECVYVCIWMRVSVCLCYQVFWCCDIIHLHAWFFYFFLTMIDPLNT